MGRVVKVGLERIQLTEELVEELLAGFEERIRRYLRSKLRRRVDEFEIIVTGEYDGSEFRVLVDARVVGKAIGPLSYEEVIAEAIEEAGKWLERRLRELAEHKVEGEEDTQGGGEGGGGDREAGGRDGT